MGKKSPYCSRCEWPIDSVKKRNHFGAPRMDDDHEAEVVWLTPAEVMETKWFPNVEEHLRFMEERLAVGTRVVPTGDQYLKRQVPEAEVGGL